MDQQTGKFRMFKCEDCGAEFSAVCSAKARGRAVPHTCPECQKQHKRDWHIRDRVARKPGKLLAARRAVFLARRDALYDAAHFPAPIVRVSNGLRIETRGQFAGSVRGLPSHNSIIP